MSNDYEITQITEPETKDEAMTAELTAMTAKIEEMTAMVQRLRNALAYFTFPSVRLSGVPGASVNLQVPETVIAVARDALR